MVTVELQDEVADALRAQARAKGLSLDAYLSSLAGRLDQSAPPLDGSMTDIDRWLDELSDGLPALPSLPQDMSRRDIYADHD
jgi:hypothetical protein